MKWLHVCSVGLVSILAGTGQVVAEPYGMISINFTGRTNAGTPEFLHVEVGESSSGVAGVNGNDMWNDLVVYGDSGMRGAFGPWHVAGSKSTSAVVTVSSRGTWSMSASGTGRIVPAENPSGDLMDGWIEGRRDSFPFTVTVSELSGDFRLYDVYAYVGEAISGRPASVTLNGSSTVAYFSSPFNGAFVEATGGNSANYVAFRGISGDSFTLIGGGINPGQGSGIHGLEIVGVPEPTVLVLLTTGRVGLLACVWRKRRR